MGVKNGDEGERDDGVIEGMGFGKDNGSLIIIWNCGGWEY